MHTLFGGQKGQAVPEQHIDYRDLSREKRLEILNSLAKIAVDIVAHHPDIRECDVEMLVNHRHSYGYMAWLAIRHAIKTGMIIARSDEHSTWLRSPEVSD